MTSQEWYRLKAFWEAGRLRRDMGMGRREAPSKSNSRGKAKGVGQVLKRSFIKAQVSVENPMLKGEYKTLKRV